MTTSKAELSVSLVFIPLPHPAGMGDASVTAERRFPLAGGSHPACPQRSQFSVVGLRHKFQGSVRL